MAWFRSLLRTRSTPPLAQPPISRRRFVAGAGAVAGGTLLAPAAWADVEARAAAFGIEPGTLVDAQGRPLDREPAVTDPFIGTIILAGFNFPPVGWAHCDGQVLSIAQNQALFSLLGTTFGGDGRTTFALPDLRGRFAMHPGSGPGLTPRRLGERGGAESVTLTAAQVPAHSHDAAQVQVRGTGTEAAGLAAGGSRGTAAVGSTGGGEAHDNVPPFLGVYHSIALTGIFPSRT
ncbi:MAG: tail fiber protein [Bacteroidota bacterium]